MYGDFSENCDGQPYPLCPASATWRLYVYSLQPVLAAIYRNYSAANEAMWCCGGTGMEDHGKYGQCVWTHDKGVKAEDDALYVNLPRLPELNWKE